MLTQSAIDHLSRNIDNTLCLDLYENTRTGELVLPVDLGQATAPGDDRWAVKSENGSWHYITELRMLPTAPSEVNPCS